MMVSRSDLRWLDAATPVREALRQAGEAEAHSWYPVCRGSLDEVVGIVSVSRLLALGPAHEGPVEPHAVPAPFVPETLSGMELLEQFRSQAARLVFVVDEYGVVQGLITPHDMLEAITGELQPASQTQAWATQREDGSWLLDGLMPVAELKARLEIRELPEEDKGRYNTLAGLLMAVTGHLPEPGERIDCGEWVFEVVDVDGRRIDKVLAQTVPEAADAAVGD
jgi:putative hemolysin